MLPSNHLDRIHIAFDGRRLVNNAGLILPTTLALHLGLPELVDRRLDLGDAPGRANTGAKIMTLVASALVGGDCIDDANALRNSFYARLKRMTPGSSAEPSGNGTRKAALTDGDKFHWRALVRGLVPCGYGGSPGPALGLDFLPCGTGMFVSISMPLVSHGNAFSDRFRASDDSESSKG